MNILYISTSVTVFNFFLSMSSIDKSAQTACMTVPVYNLLRQGYNHACPPNWEVAQLPLCYIPQHTPHGPVKAAIHMSIDLK